jgi:hypothetical protein
MRRKIAINGELMRILKEIMTLFKVLFLPENRENSQSEFPLGSGLCRGHYYYLLVLVR